MKTSIRTIAGTLRSNLARYASLLAGYRTGRVPAVLVADMADRVRAGRAALRAAMARPALPTVLALAAALPPAIACKYLADVLMPVAAI
jgi:hypothetical protein